jgi:hypothetical protein
MSVELPTGVTAASAAKQSPSPALEPTPLDGVYRLRHGERLGLDVANLKGQSARDGYLSWEDAAARGVPRAKWDELVKTQVDPALRLTLIVRLFKEYAHRAPVTLKVGEREIKVAPERAKKLATALSVIRRGIEGAREQGLQVAYPVVVDGRHRAADGGRSVFVVDPERYRARLSMTDDEAFWLFDNLVQKSERVWSNGGWHYMTTELKQVCDERVRAMATDLLAARATGKKTIYLSTFISSGDPAVNREIAKFVERKVDDNPQFAADIFVLNPVTQQLVPGAKGDDYMYMWEQLIRLNLFDAVRFTSSKDTLAYFEAKGEHVPHGYHYTYGDVLHSVGCRRELALFADINRQLAEQGHAHLQIPIYYGDDPLPPSLLAVEAHNTSYATRGEHPDA